MNEKGLGAGGIIVLSSIQFDELYHLLRCLSNGEDEEEIDAVLGLTRHLLEGGDYTGLTRYSKLYGERFLVGKVAQEIKDAGWDFSRIVDLGSGLGWLGSGISARFGLIPVVRVDKRSWPGISLLADLETEEGIGELLRTLGSQDVIVMADFLHCIDQPEDLITKIKSWNKVILEYFPGNADYRSSYSRQILRYGALPLNSIQLSGLFPTTVCHIHVGPYELLLVEGGK